MGATITQSTVAAFPGRPATEGANGLLVTLTAGTGGQYVERDLGEALGRVNVRLMLGPATATGGEVELLRGIAPDDSEAWRIKYNASTGVIVVILAGSGTALTGPIVTGLAWQCVELSVSAGAAALWINGIAAATGSLTGQTATRRLWIGAPSKASGTTGTVWLDEVKVGSGYQGGVEVATTDTTAAWLAETF
jgi:hypothetical protein